MFIVFQVVTIAYHVSLFGEIEIVETVESVVVEV